MALVVKSAVRDQIKEMRISGSIWDTLDKKVDKILKEAAKRAKANGRKTIQPNDL